LIVLPTASISIVYRPEKRVVAYYGNKLEKLVESIQGDVDIHRHMAKPRFMIMIQGYYSN
jgi:hypothetical protein